MGEKTLCVSRYQYAKVNFITFIKERRAIMRKETLIVLLSLLIFFGTPWLLRAEEGVTDTEIILGGHMDLTGPSALWGIMMKNGLELRTKEINESGGIYGRKIRTVIEDSQYDPKTAVMVTNKLINRDKVFAFINNTGSACALATKPIISRAKIPQIFPLVSTSAMHEPFDRYSFSGYTPAYDEARAMAKYFVEYKKYNKIGMLAQDDEMGEILKKGLEDQLATYNMKLTEIEYYKRGAADFSSQIAKLRKADVQLVALGTIIRETVGAWKEAKAIGWKVDMCSLKQTLNTAIPMLSQKSGISLEGLYVTTITPYIVDSPRPAVRDWWKKYVSTFGKDPDQPAIYGPLTLYYFEVAAKIAGRDLTREKFIDALETFRDVQDPVFGTVPVTFTNTNHQGATGVILQQYQGGTYRPVIEGYIDYRKK